MRGDVSAGFELWQARLAIARSSWKANKFIAIGSTLFTILSTAAMQRNLETRVHFRELLNSTLWCNTKLHSAAAQRDLVRHTSSSKEAAMCGNAERSDAFAKAAEYKRVWRGSLNWSSWVVLERYSAH